MLLLPLLLACTPTSDELARSAVRVSMALRGTHPSPRELDALLAGEVTLESLARDWVRDPAFGETVRDQHAEQLLLRWDTEAHPPPLGPLEGVPQGELGRSLDEEPLRLVERIVLEGRPYTGILTAPTTVADETVATAYGLAWDPAGPDWQELAWPDGRPAAGILASTGVWQRHMSSDTNYQRARANLLFSRLLCQPFDAAGRGVRLPSTSPDAVRDDPECAACHTRLDPVASAFFGFRRYVLPSEIRGAYAEGCAEGADCYPFTLWSPDAVDDWAEVGMPTPAWNGEPVADLTDLLQRASEEPAFATCTTRRFAQWLTRVEEPDPNAVAEWSANFVDGGYDARELAVDLVLSEDFLAGPRALARPEQYDRLLTSLTAYTFDALPGEGWGPVGLLTNDEHGLRALSGGIDGWHSIRADDGASPTRELSWEWGASEAAASLVATGRFDGVERRSDVRDTLEGLHRRWLAEVDPDVGASLALFEEVSARRGPRHAWVVVLTALLLDDRVVGY